MSAEGATALREAIRLGLRKSRHEEAPIPIIREDDLFHITHMVWLEVDPLLAEVRRDTAERIAQAIEALPGPDAVALDAWRQQDRDVYLLAIEEAAAVSRSDGAA